MTMAIRQDDALNGQYVERDAQHAEIRNVIFAFVHHRISRMEIDIRVLMQF